MRAAVLWRCDIPLGEAAGVDVGEQRGVWGLRHLVMSKLGAGGSFLWMRVTECV